MLKTTNQNYWRGEIIYPSYREFQLFFYFYFWVYYEDINSNTLLSGGVMGPHEFEWEPWTQPPQCVLETVCISCPVCPLTSDWTHWDTLLFDAVFTPRCQKQQEQSPSTQLFHTHTHRVWHVNLYCKPSGRQVGRPWSPLNVSRWPWITFFFF